MPELAGLQREFTAHIRNPAAVKTPPGIESRRMKIYNDLIYNNIEGFISGGFPITRSLYRDEDWHRLVRSFISQHRSESPYFLEISQEFINFVMQEYQPSPVDPPFLLELVHYEWVELALDVAEDEFPELEPGLAADPLVNVPVISPLAWSLAYQYPVHTLGPGTEPDSPPAEPTYLVVYRNRAEEVKFLAINAATARLLELVRDNSAARPSAARTGQVLLQQLAREMNVDSVTSVVDFGATMLRQFLELDILAGCSQPLATGG
ncbi:MAG: putative DNA-binding domain-containing protein [Gammaproteobacteria bacterium]|nr:putative DNA-binding domain-containing protein [Gammaproteobacteria bacterium]